MHDKIKSTSGQHAPEAYRHSLSARYNVAYARHEAELRKLEKDTRKIIEAIKSGFANPKLKAELDYIVQREEELKVLMEGAAEDLPALHPSMADRYRKEVTNLIDSLNDQENRTEAATLLRKLIDKIVLKPDPDGPGLLIDLHGDLAGILTMAAKNGKSLTPGDLSMLQEKLGKSPETNDASPKSTEGRPELSFSGDPSVKLVAGVVTDL